MPPKNKFSEEQIILAAVDVVRQSTADGLTARSLADKLSSSPKVIFGYFKSMEDVKMCVIKFAHELYLSYLKEEIEKGEHPYYKASGMGYIRFAVEEKELFKLLFMRDRTNEPTLSDADDSEIDPLLDIVVERIGITREEARLFHLEMWLCVHGIATIIATDYLKFDVDFISSVLTDVYNGMLMRFAAKKENNGNN